jgi:hypothetical protein
LKGRVIEGELVELEPQADLLTLGFYLGLSHIIYVFVDGTSSTPSYFAPRRRSKALASSLPS